MRRLVTQDGACGFARFKQMPRHTPMAERNRQMLAAYEAGESVKALAAHYGLKQASVRTLLTAEKHRRAVCPEPLYRALRGEGVSA